MITTSLFSKYKTNLQHLPLFNNNFIVLKWKFEEQNLIYANSKPYPPGAARLTAAVAVTVVDDVDLV